MNFEILDKQMRRFEQSLDRTMLEGIYVVARLVVWPWPTAL